MSPNQTELNATTRLAMIFSRHLLEYIGAENLAEVNARNAREPLADLICHSHDFCDANQIHLNAWEEYFGPGTCPAFIDEATAAEKERDLELCNRSWSLAKRCGFDSARILAEGDRKP